MQKQCSAGGHGWLPGSFYFTLTHDVLLFWFCFFFKKRCDHNVFLGHQPFWTKVALPECILEENFLVEALMFAIFAVSNQVAKTDCVFTYDTSARATLVED